MNEQSEKTYQLWNEFVHTQKAQILPEILANEIKFYSPFVWKPKDKKEAILILMTVIKVLEDFRYTRKIFDENLCALEFEARIDKITLQGVDIIEFDDSGKIIDFKVMIRPANGLQALGEKMNELLAAKNQTRETQNI